MTIDPTPEDLAALNPRDRGLFLALQIQMRIPVGRWRATVDQIEDEPEAREAAHTYLKAIVGRMNAARRAGA